MVTAPITRVLSRVDITDPGCWLWPGAGGDRYGGVWASPPYVEKPTMLLVHRVTYEYFIEDITDGLEIDHLCRVKACCNPTHLELVTHQVNAARRSAEITHCPQNHPYTEANTYVNVRGHRQCLECTRAQKREWDRVDRSRKSPSDRR